MANIKVSAAEQSEKPKEAPVVRVRNRGQISSTLELYANAYRKRYPEMAVRYVYDPTHKQELSGVLGRMSSGYRLVTMGELGLDHVTVDMEEKPVRVGDLVLMAVDAKTKRELELERAEAARDQMQSVQRNYYDNIEKEAQAVQPAHHTRPGARPTGAAAIKSQEFIYDIEQRGEQP